MRLVSVLTRACERWGCWFGPRTKRCNRCGTPDFASMTNAEIDAYDAENAGICP